MSALARLLAALATGTLPAWAEAHAPDGECDAAVRRAWNDERSADEIWCVLSNLPPQATQAGADAWLHRALHADHLMHYRGYDREGCTCLPDDETQPYQPCVVCCEALRAEIPCPTWAELTAA